MLPICGWSRTLADCSISESTRAMLTTILIFQKEMSNFAEFLHYISKIYPENLYEKRVHRNVTAGNNCPCACRPAQTSGATVPSSLTSSSTSLPHRLPTCFAVRISWRSFVFSMFCSQSFLKLPFGSVAWRIFFALSSTFFISLSSRSPRVGDESTLKCIEMKARIVGREYMSTHVFNHSLRHVLSLA